jgi:threonine aldolase
MIQHARRIRKVLGGGMRQAGILASAGLYALENHLDRLREDNQLAKYLESILNASNTIKEVWPVESNIVIFEVQDSISVQIFLDHLSGYDIKAFQVGPKHVRFVTHLDLPSDSAERLNQALSEFSS